MWVLQQPSDRSLTNPECRGFDSSARWATTYQNYEQYAVTGMKLRWIPTNARGNVSQVVTGASGVISSGIVNSYCKPMIVYYDPDTYDTRNFNLEKIMALDKCWVRDPTRPWSKYFPLKMLSKTQNLKWQDTRDWSAGSVNGLTNASVCTRMEYKGQGGDDDTLGYFKASWYVTFKGQAYQA